ncbi:hypothetical protein Ccrd_020480, partial [Cynara cardunculus var. scolymus]
MSTSCEHRLVVVASDSSIFDESTVSASFLVFPSITRSPSPTSSTDSTCCSTTSSVEPLSNLVPRIHKQLHHCLEERLCLPLNLCSTLPQSPSPQLSQKLQPHFQLNHDKHLHLKPQLLPYPHSDHESQFLSAYTLQQILHILHTARQSNLFPLAPSHQFQQYPLHQFETLPLIQNPFHNLEPQLSQQLKHYFQLNHDKHLLHLSLQLLLSHPYSDHETLFLSAYTLPPIEPNPLYHPNQQHQHPQHPPSYPPLHLSHPKPPQFSPPHRINNHTSFLNPIHITILMFLHTSQTRSAT